MRVKKTNESKGEMTNKTQNSKMLVVAEAGCWDMRIHVEKFRNVFVSVFSMLKF